MDRVAPIIHAAIDAQDDEETRTLLRTAIDSGDLQCRVVERLESMWLEFSVAGEPLVAVAVADVAPDLAETRIEDLTPLD